MPHNYNRILSRGTPYIMQHKANSKQLKNKTLLCLSIMKPAIDKKVLKVRSDYCSRIVINALDAVRNLKFVLEETLKRLNHHVRLVEVIDFVVLCEFIILCFSTLNRKSN